MKTPRGISALGTFLFFIIFLVALGALWVGTGGPSRSISHSSPFLRGPTVPGVSAGGTISTGGSIEADTSGGGSGSNSGSSQTNSRSLLDYFFNYKNGVGGANDAASPYANDISLSSGNAQSENPDTEYVEIRTSSDLAKPVTITGWALESKTLSIRASIGSAAQIPISGQVNNDYPITLGPDSVVYISTGRSPNGGSFRINKCTGYFGQFQNFTPQLENSCPNPYDEALRNPQKTAGNTDCIDFINNLRECELYTGAIPPSAGSSCQDFIQNDLTYNGCVALHRNDPDFFKNEWRVYLNRQQELWQNNHDQIRLLDENGNLIASYTY